MKLPANETHPICAGMKSNVLIADDKRWLLGETTVDDRGLPGWRLLVEAFFWPALRIIETSSPKKFMFADGINRPSWR
jgi:hypothetical protein